jgi:hypothetical protein
MEDAVASSPDADLAKYKRMFTEAQTVTETARIESQTDDDYYNGFQYTAEERRILADRKQPDNVFNRVRPGVLGWLGVLKQGKTSPRAYGRNPGDEQASDIVSKVLRFIADEARWNDTRIDGSQNYLIQGTCAVIVEPNDLGRVEITHIRWEEFFYDPRARRQDFSDARYLGVAKWMYADDVEAMYPEFKGQLQSGMDAAMVTMGTTFNDRPMNGAVTWIDPKRRRVLVVDVYHREGPTWMFCRFYGNGVLESGPSPYLDERKRPSCPIVAQSCFIDRENNRYGIVRDMRGPQDEINKRRAKLLNLLTMRQLLTTVEGFDASADVARAQAARPDGVIPYGFEVADLNVQIQGQMELLNLAIAEIERMSPNPAILGRAGQDESGRAQLVRQQAGMTEGAVVMGGIEEWELRVYRRAWVTAKQFWKAADYIRVTDDMNAPEYIGINQPVVQNVPAIVPHPETGMPMVGMKQMVMGYQNALGELDVDITLDTVANTANIAQEQFQMLADLARADAIQIPLPLLIQMSSLPNKQELLDKLDQMSQQQPSQDQVLALQQKEADIAKTNSETVKNQADAATKIGTQAVAEGQLHLNALQAGMEAVQPPPEPKTAAG